MPSWSTLTHLSLLHLFFFFFSSRRRHTRFDCDWSSDVCSSDLLRVLGCAVWERQQGSQAPVDARAHSVLGRRLLELLRAELIRTWGEDSTAAVQMPAMLAGIERVRESIEPDWTPYFASRLSGPDGLELLVQVAHDLRSPLTSVLFLADTLLRDQSGPVNELQRRQLRLVYGASLGLTA